MEGTTKSECGVDTVLATKTLTLILSQLVLAEYRNAFDPGYYRVGLIELRISSSSSQ